MSFVVVLWAAQDVTVTQAMAGDDAEVKVVKYHTEAPFNVFVVLGLCDHSLHF